MAEISESVWKGVDMDKHCIISLGREFGSGGHKIAQMISQQAEIPYYDNELIILAAQRGELPEGLLGRHDEKKHNSLLYQINYSGNKNVCKGDSLTNTLYLLQKNVILDIADKGDAVIVGRSADCILADAGKNVLSVFIKAPKEYRIRRTMELEGLDEKTVTYLLKKKDKQRKDFYESRTGMKWGDARHYDMVFDTSECDFNFVVDAIIEKWKCCKQ